MSAIEITFRNSHDSPLLLQIDPWANLYQIDPKEEFSIVAESDTATPILDVDRYNEKEMIVTILRCNEFYVLQNGKRLHHMREFRTNMEGV